MKTYCSVMKINIFLQKSPGSTIQMLASCCGSICGEVGVGHALFVAVGERDGHSGSVSMLDRIISAYFASSQ